MTGMVLAWVSITTGYVVVRATQSLKGLSTGILIYGIWVLVVEVRLLPCPALPCPALPCPALPCPARVVLQYARLCCASMPYLHHLKYTSIHVGKVSHVMFTISY